MMQSDDAPYIPIFTVLLIAPFLCFSGLFDFADLPKKSFIQGATALTLLIFCINAARQKKIQAFSGGFYLILPAAFLLWALLSLHWAVNIHDGLQILLPWLNCALVFGILAQTPWNPKWSGHLMAALAISGGGVALIGLAQHFGGLEWIPQASPPGATFANRNLSAQFVSLSIPVYLLFCLARKRLRYRILAGSGLFGAAVFIFAAQHRTSMLAIGVSILIFGIYGRQDLPFRLLWKSRWGLKPAMMVAGGLTVLAAAFFYFQPKGISLEQWVRHPVLIGKQLVYSDSSSVRRNLWLNSLAMIRDSPFQGVGAGNYTVHYPKYHQAVVKDHLFNMSRRPVHTHNDFLQMAAELGIPGLLLWLGILAGLFLWAAKLTFRDQSAETRQIVSVAVSMIVVFILQSGTGFPAYMAMPPFILCVFSGLLANGYNRLHHPLITVPLNRTTGLILCAVAAIVSVWAVNFQVRDLTGSRYYALARQAEDLEDWDELVLNANRALRHTPHEAQVLAALGRGYLESGQFAKSLEMGRRLLEIDPHNINGLLNLGVTYHGLKNQTMAVDLFLQTLAIKPDFARAWANLGKIYLQKKEIKSAEEYLTRAALYDPHNTAMHLDLALIKYGNGDHAAAAVHYEKALKSSPRSPVAHKMLALIYLQHLPDSDKASSHMERFIQIAPQDPMAARFRRELDRLSRERAGPYR